jgi:c-di-GMP-binding flagellar brake protein YcgR
VNETESEQTQILSNRGAVRAVLERILGSRSRITITPKGAELSQTSRLLLVDKGSDRMLFDRMGHDGPAESLVESGAATVELDVEGVRTWFDVDGLTAVEEEGDIYYAANFPTEIRRLERRRHFRAPTPRDMDAKVKFSSGVGDVPSGEIVDVSVSGIGALFPGDVAAVLKSKGRLAGSRVYLGNDLGFESDLAVCFCGHQKGSGRTKVGFRIAKIRPADERKLARLIFKLELMQRKLR